MTETQKYRRFLDRQADQAKDQHEKRASGAFGPARNTPEEIHLWRGIESGFRQALEEFDLFFDGK